MHQIPLFAVLAFWGRGVDSPTCGTVFYTSLSTPPTSASAADQFPLHLQLLASNYGVGWRSGLGKSLKTLGCVSNDRMCRGIADSQHRIWTSRSRCRIYAEYGCRGVSGIVLMGNSCQDRDCRSRISCLFAVKFRKIDLPS